MRRPGRRAGGYTGACVRVLSVGVAILLAGSGSGSGSARADTPDLEPIEREVRALIRVYDENASNQDAAHRRRRRAVAHRLGALPTPTSRKQLLRIVKDDPGPRVRIAAMTALGTIADLDAMKKLLTLVERSDEELLGSTFAGAVARCADPEAARWLALQLPRIRDAGVRLAVVEALGSLRVREAEPALLALEVGPRALGSPALRYECLRALGRIGGRTACRVLLLAARSKQKARRLAAAEMLLTCERDERTLAAMRGLLGDPDVLVHEQAARSVGEARLMELVPELIALLESGRLRVKHEAQKSLRAITGRDLGYVPETWLQWWKARSEGRLDAAGNLADGSGFSVPKYYDFKVFSDRLLFVVDVSESMKIGDGRVTRIDVAGRQLLKTIGELREPTQFNVITFAGSPNFWEKGLKPATETHRRRAARWVSKQLLPRGGTNTYDTLLRALHENPELDTLYLLSDGLPTAGKATVPEQILARVRDLNRLRRVRIHTIALLLGAPPDEERGGVGETADMTDFMRRLAEQNGGTFIEIRSAPP